ncbi:unnamed protein product [Lactuca saligna]|uniref:Uncharacterized protein n=1 Tax=Lactuca saligna TaxID=75948 RepID=A0AA35YAC3_LACSI|nr:unnamed protein product [Lactuca saligna]
MSPRFFLSVSDFILARGLIDETRETSEIAPCSLCGCVRIQRLMAAIGVSKAPYFFSTRCCVCLRVRVSRGRNRCEAFRSKTPTGGAAFSRLLVLVPIVSCSKRFGFVSCSGAFSRLLVQDIVQKFPLDIKSLDKSCLGPLRKAYCSSLNLLLRHEAREFANELRAFTKASRNPTVLLEGSTGSNQNLNNADTYTALNNMPKCSPYLSHFFLMSPVGLITCMTQGTTSLLSNIVYAISDAATQDPPGAGKTQTILGLLSAILQTS